MYMIYSICKVTNSVLLLNLSGYQLTDNPLDHIVYYSTHSGLVCLDVGGPGITSKYVQFLQS